MSRVITFSRQFPLGHPKSGQPTQFIEKIWKSIGGGGHEYTIQFATAELSRNIVWGYQLVDGYKYHTIRKGKRWKVGDKFSPRVWGEDINPKSGRKGPYQSKQIAISKDLEVKKIWGIKMVWDNDVDEVDIFIDGIWRCQMGSIQSEEYAKNDGLSIEDFEAWFNIKKGKPFDGQIICWNDRIEY